MRNPQRIDKFCDELKEVWRQFPDWRFGQLMSNMMGEYCAQTGRDVFFLEEPEMMEWFRKYAELDK